MATLNAYENKQWSLMAESLLRDMKEELKEPLVSNWGKILKQILTNGKKLRVLDIGCGIGYFAILLARMGHIVTAIDSNREILNLAKIETKDEIFDYPIEFIYMDAEELTFKDETYDIVISRYASWLFKNPKKAIKECYRVLNSKGKLINIDANWMMPFFDQSLKRRFQRDQEELRFRGYDEKSVYEDKDAVEYMMNLPLANIKRPDWDKRELEKIGFKEIQIDWLLNKKIWNEQYSIAYKNIPTFIIRALKGESDNEK